MSVLEMKVPSPGESISEVEIAQWLVSDGDYVEKDQAIAEVDSDKATLELPAEESGTITLKAEEGDAVEVGAIVCLIDTSAERPAGFESTADTTESVAVPEPVKAKVAPEEKTVSPDPVEKKSYAAGTPSIAAAKIMAENDINPSQVNGTGKGGRITKQDVVSAMAAGFDAGATQGWGGTREQNREKMSMMRRKIAERLVAVKNETAMLTTFNEVNMAPLMKLRRQYKEQFEATHNGTRLGFMGFFVRAACEALKRFPAVNASIDGNDVVYHGYQDIGVAVSIDEGLVVPILRDADFMSIADIEAAVHDLGVKARDKKLTIEEMTGGTFTVSNGGVFGSLLSTPILNPPQTGILGMHTIQDRPIAMDGEVVIQPMMYLALSYDHRLVDGKTAVQFLVAIKGLIEDPARILLQL